MEFRLSEEQEMIRRHVREVCEQYPDEYWRELDSERRYPEEFVRTLTEARWLGALIPEQYGGLGLGVIEASIILEELENKTAGLSVFLLDLSTPGIEIRPSETMINYDTNEVFFRNARVPAENLIGEEGKGFRYILDGMNVERILVASESIGDGRWFVERASAYASERVVFGRPIGQNQGVQFPVARAFASVEAASMMRYKAASLFDA